MDRQTKEFVELQNAFKLQKMEFDHMAAHNDKIQQDLNTKSLELKVMRDY